VNREIWSIGGLSWFWPHLGKAALRCGDKVAATARNAADVADLTKRFGDAVFPMALDVTDPGREGRATGLLSKARVFTQ
jgi:NADP-dependent 3-hydroxy acid dehydrogenase YdfG